MLINTFLRLNGKFRAYLALRKLKANLDGPVALGFWVGRRLALAGAAVRPDATFVRFAFLSCNLRWTHDEIQEFLRQVAKLSAGAPTTAIVSGLRDKQAGHDLSEHFSEVVRIENGLLANQSSSKLRTAFLINREGIYFDGRSPSDSEAGLEALAPGYASRSPAAQELLDYVRRTHITKYVPDDIEAERIEPGSLLILGQVNGDQATASTVTIRKSNLDFISWIYANRPVPNVVRHYYKPHPRNRLDNEREIAKAKAKHPDLRVIAPGVNVHELFKQRPRVATMTSGAGLEAALHGCEIHTFGISFYSNFGFTIDHFDCSRRTNRLSAEDVAAFMWIEQTVYVDPETRRPVPVEVAFGLPYDPLFSD